MENSVLKFKSIFHTHSNLLQLSDAKLLSEDGYEFDIHRFQLAKNSEYFRAMFCGVLSKDRREFTIPGISGECLGEILYFIYTGYVSVTEHNIADLLVASDYLVLTILYQIVKGRVITCLTAANSFRLFAAAEKVNDRYLSMISFRYIQIQFEVILQNKGNGLSDLPVDVLQKILSNNSICVRSESTVWRVIVDWIQEHVAERLKYIPKLLSLLARKEIDEDLATQVLKHDTIIYGNVFLPGLNNTSTSLDFSSNLEVLQKLLENYEGIDYRIPPELHVVILKAAETVSSTLYLTYDENMDFWRKIDEVNFYPVYAIPIGHYVFVFGDEECLKFDLSSQQCFPLRNFRNSIRNFSVVAVDNKLYVLGEVNFNNYYWEYCFEVYDPDTDLWVSGTCPINISNAIAVAISKKIYVVGYTANGHDMVAQVFDVETWQWSLLPEPSFYRVAFSMVAFHEYLYLFGGSDDWNDATKVEIFDTKVNVWIEIADIQHVYWWINAVVWKDQIIVYDNTDDWNESESIVSWNEEQNSWEAYDNSSGINLRSQLFSTIRHVDSVKTITRRSRNPDNKFYRSCFN